MKDSIKIQINSLEALERLLGKEPQFEFEVRRSVSDTFLKRISAGTIPQVISDYLTSMIIENNGSTYSPKWVLTAAAKKAIKSEIMTQSSSLVSGLVTAEFEKTGLTKLIEEKAKYVAGTLADKVLNERFEQLVDLELKKRLGIK